MFFTSGTGVLSCTWADVGMPMGMRSRLMANTPAWAQLTKLTRFIKNLLPRTDLSSSATLRGFFTRVAKDVPTFPLQRVREPLDHAKAFHHTTSAPICV